MMAERVRLEAHDRHQVWSGDRERKIAKLPRGMTEPALEGLDTALYLACELDHAAALLRALLACSRPCQTEVKQALARLEREHKAATTPQKPAFRGGTPR